MARPGRDPSSGARSAARRVVGHGAIPPCTRTGVRRVPPPAAGRGDPRRGRAGRARGGACGRARRNRDRRDHLFGARRARGDAADGRRGGARRGRGRRHGAHRGAGARGARRRGAVLHRAQRVGRGGGRRARVEHVLLPRRLHDDRDPARGGHGGSAREGVPGRRRGRARLHPRDPRPTPEHSHARRRRDPPRQHRAVLRRRLRGLRPGRRARRPRARRGREVRRHRGARARVRGTRRDVRRTRSGPRLMSRFTARMRWLLLAGLLALLAAPRARASYEEFATLDVGREEEDDENLLDHVLVQPPPAWAAEWARATRGFRTSQGCFTAGQWYLDNELKVKVPMGDMTYFDLGIREVADDEATYDWTQFDLRFPLRHAGLWGFRFRPTFDKGRADMGVLGDLGMDTSRIQVQAVFGLADIFNKFWALRQTRVGDDSEPYLKHPYEPALHLAWRGEVPHFDANVKWLTPSNKRFVTRDTLLLRREVLWGVKHDASLAQRFGRYGVMARF